MAQKSGSTTSKLTRRDFLARMVVVACGAVLSRAADGTVPSEGSTRHVVQKGETVWQISRKYGVKPEEIIELNKLQNPDSISPGQVLTIPHSAAPSPVDQTGPSEVPSTHIVKKGETVWGIARKYNADPAEIIRANNLSRPYRIFPGDELIIPGLTSADSRLQGVSWLCHLPGGVRPRGWRYIVIHHSYTTVGNAAIFDRYHRRRRMENGLAYHFVIGNGNGSGDGEIEVGGRWKKQLHGGHVRSNRMNEISIGICLVGNFELTYPTKRQMDSLALLVKHLMDEYDIPKRRVVGHHDVNHTKCPGKNFPLQSFKNGL